MIRTEEIKDNIDDTGSGVKANENAFSTLIHAIEKQL